MDDGQQVKRGGVTLCTDSFNSKEIGILREALKSNFNLITTIHRKKGRDNSEYERIYINKDSLEEVKPFLKEHMHSSMLYKLNENSVSTDENVTMESGSSNITKSDTSNFDIGSDFGSDIGEF